MLVTEKISDKLMRTYSNAGYYILGSDGIMYEDAVDLIDLSKSYDETDIIINYDDLADPSDYRDALEDLGVTFDE